MVGVLFYIIYLLIYVEFQGLVKSYAKLFPGLSAFK